MVRVARITSWVLLTTLCILVTNAEAVDLTWSPVNTAVDGSSIPASVIAYRVYYSADDSNYSLATETTQTNMSVDAITSGCYFLHVTALRTDNNQESVPSNSIEYCAGQVVDQSPAPAAVEPEAPTGVNIVE
jgi:hypothetical protein